MSGLSILWFLVIVVLIPLSLWLLKRGSPAGLFGPGQHAAARVVATLPLGPQQRIVTLETGPQDQRVWLVLGVTAQSITTLHSMPAQASPQTSGSAEPPAFAALLAKLQGPRS